MQAAHSSTPTVAVTCHHCGCQLSSEAALKTHLLIAHNEKKSSRLKCHLCAKLFLRETQLRKHQEFCHTGQLEKVPLIGQPPLLPLPPRYRCQHCAAAGKSTECASLYLYQRHLLARHKCAAAARKPPAEALSGSCPCAECAVDPVTYAELAAFVRKQRAAQRNHVCPVCRKGFRTSKVKFDFF
jgi:hypothetical protein